ncbi:MAG: AAA family ATPase [Polyangia bacterium]
MTEKLGKILQALGDRGLRRSGGGWAARCPAHDDKEPSLSIQEDSRNGNVLIKCHRGCSVEAVMREMGLAMMDLFPSKQAPSPKGDTGGNERLPPVEASYDYTDANGKVLFQVVVRRRPGSSDKKIYQRRPDGAGGWLNNLDGVTPVLYRLPELLSSPPEQMVFIPEGEKCVEALRAVGLVATTNPGGAGKWDRVSSKPLQDRHIVVLPDNDDVGRQHGEMVAFLAGDYVESVKVVHLVNHFPALAEKGDVFDWLAAGHSAKDLLAIVEQTPRWRPDQPSTVKLPASTNLATVKPVATVWIWTGRIAKGEMVLITGAPGVGKGLLLCCIASKYTQGRPMFGDVGSRPPGVVLWISIEDADDTALVPRLSAAGADLSRIHSWKTNSSLPTLPETTDQILAEIEKVHAGLLFVDPAPTLLTDKFTANSDADVRRTYGPLAAGCRERGCSIVLVRHINKRPGGDAMSRGGGSIGWTGMTRIELMLGKKPCPADDAAENGGPKTGSGDESEIILAPVKSNLGRWPSSLSARIVETAGAPRLEFTGETTTSADDLVDQQRPHKGQVMENALDLLRRLLADGQWHRAREIERELQKAGISFSTMKRAKTALEIQSHQNDREWWWLLPPQGTSSPATGANDPLNYKPSAKQQGGGEGEPLTYNNNNNLQTQNVTGSESAPREPLAKSGSTDTAPEPLTVPAREQLSPAEPGCVPLASAAPSEPEPLPSPPLVSPALNPEPEPEPEDLV